MKRQSAACLVLLAALTTPIDAAVAADRPAIEHFTRPGSRAPFSPAVRVGDTLYLSGQIGATADGKVPPDMANQARLAMENVKAALALAGSDMSAVFKCTVMLDDMSQWAEFNRVYITYFEPGRLPARSAFGTNGLAFGAGVEVECLAHSPAGKRQ